MRRDLRSAGAILAICVAALTCSDSPAGNSDAQAGWLAINMTTPSTDDGGIILVVTGGKVDSARSTFPDVLTRSETATSFRMVVGGALTSGKIAEIWVPDVRKASSYKATPVEVASRAFAQRAITGYSLRVARLQ